MVQGEGADGVATDLRSPAAGAPEPRQVQLLESAPETGGGDSERPNTAASLAQEKETPQARHLASTKVLVKDFSETQPEKGTQDSPAAATHVLAAPNHPLYCLY